ncbi:MAG TPA: hypothetical protein VGY55_06750, partial [Pirellulales bacterium]|nr:hypothetical protein [Pirellulales bacterium]
MFQASRKRRRRSHSENRPRRGGQSPLAPDHLAMVPAPQKGTVPGGTRRSRPRRLSLEALEARQMLSASPTLVTTASFQNSSTVVGSAIPEDSAALSGGDQASGAINFTLTAPDNSVVDTETISPNGDATYNTSNVNVATQVGTYTWAVSFAGDSLNNPASDQGGPAEQLTTIKASATLVTSATVSAGNVVGSAIPQDSAVLSGGYQETGPLTFTLTAPDNSVVDTETVTPNGDGTYNTSNVNVGTQVGTYTWAVSYAGDGLNLPANDQGGTAEQVATIKSSPTISTSASETAGGVVGSAALGDSVAVSGGDNPTGTVTFTLTAPNGATSPAGTVTIAGDGTYNAPTVAATQVGVYTWHASYGGDGLNNGAVDNGSNESITTVAASPTLVTTASFGSGSGSVVGSAIPEDSAVLSGGYQENGPLTFTLTAPNNSVVDTQIITPSGDGTYNTTNVSAATQAGIYTWTVSYAGDGLNNSQHDQGGAAETVTTVKASPKLVTTASFKTGSGTVVGTAIPEDSAVLSGGYQESGPLTFTLTAPNNSAVDTQTITPSGDGTYSTTNTTIATQAGTYTWTVSFAGDGLNNSTHDQGGAAEQVTTVKASPTLVTTASFETGSTSVVGSAIPEDSALLSGGYQESGPLTFTLTAPNSSVVDTQTITPSGDGTYNTSNATIATQAGTYTWTVSFAGDGLNNSAHDQGGTAEQVTTVKASPTIATVASAGGTIGSASVFDTATLSGGYNETGNIVFTLYDSSNTAVFSSTKPAVGNGAVTSGSFAPTTAGTYHWSATYVGDGNNNGPVSDNGSNESVTMGWANPLPAGTWTPLGHAAPSGIGTMELLTDGTVMALSGGNYYKLTPDATGSYVNGTWSQLASPSVQRLYDATNVLQDGRVLVLGGEYSGPSNTLDTTNTGEIYNPVTNIWANIPSFPLSNFGDDPSTLLPDGRVLAAYLSGPQTYIYNPATNSWSTGPTKLFNDASDEETWTKLADGSILSYDIWGNTQEAQRFDPATMAWIDSGRVPVALDNGGEIGPAVLLPDGRVFQIGGTSNTALYTPSATPGGTGSWAAGPVIPGGFVANDAPGAIMVNGDVLFAAGSGSTTKIYEFDPTANSLTDVTPSTPNLSGTVAFVNRMLALPSGQVLFTSSGSQLYVYTPSGLPRAAWQPTITSVVPAGNNYTLTGTQLNGLSAGASYGDDAEMDTNYPIVELNNGAGHVYFARTFNWSSTGVATGSTPVSTSFSLPASMPYGTYSLTVVANGISSNPVPFTGGIVGPSADLAITNNGPSTSTEGTNVTYSLTVTNNGPTTATNVVLTDTLGTSLTYVSATKSQGTSSQSGSVVTFSFGSINVGQTVTATVTAESIDSGHLTNTVSVTSSLSDANLNNNTAGAITVVTDPAIVVSAPFVTSSTTLTNQTVATFTHASGLEPASTFVARINWGDGATSAGVISLSGTTYSVTGSHTFVQSGSHTIITTVVEVPAGPWSQVANLAPASGLDTMELLSDGTVMVFTTTSAVYKLTPDSTGSYANGTWSQLASMSTARVSNTTNVLPNGRVLVIGGQNTNTGETYDPVANTWSSIAPLPESTLYNVPSVLLANGTVLVGSRVGAQTYIYNPATNVWAAGPTRLFNDQSYGEKWTKLPDGSLLSYDIWNNVGEAQRLDPSTMTWIDSGTVPVSLGIEGKATGPSMLLPDGRVFLIGGMGAVDGNSDTAIYTPSTTPGGTGTWVSGPALPDGAGGRLSSAAFLPTGHVLFAVGNLPVHLFEFDPTAPIATSLTEVTPTMPDLSGQMASVTRMLDLPSGQILFEGAPNTSELDLYTPSGSPQAAWKPTITSVVASGNNYTLTGTQLNGLSAGASYSPAYEMDSNYPIIELKSGSGLVYFARTSNWSSTGVATGSTPVSTSFSLPASMPNGSYSLTVIANGIASNPVPFTGGIVGPSADLAVTNNGPGTSTEGNTVTYSLTVTNNGPSTATNVVLTDTLSANLTYVSATKSQGTVSHS